MSTDAASGFRSSERIQARRGSVDLGPLGRLTGAGGGAVRYGQPAVGQEPVRVLIVDDHELFARTLEVFLDNSDAVEVVGVAHDGVEAVAIAAARDPQVVLMDVGLPGIDGFEAARRLLAIRRGARILALTARSEDEVRAEAEAAGMIGYLSKDHVDDTVVDAILRAAGQ